MEELENILPLHLRGLLKGAFGMSQRPEEIRIRVGQPVMVNMGGYELFWDKHAGVLKKSPDGAYKATERDLQETVAYISQYSLYAFEEELREGYLTIQGGHRIGIAGKAVCHQGHMKTIGYISFLNIRIAGEQKGCANEVIAFLRNKGTIYNTLIISPPGVGKTTLLRDCIRQLSCGTPECSGLRIGVVDERSEIAACYLGRPQNDLGPRTDVMDCCPKAEGMLRLLRSMSPQVLGVDELGGQADYEAVEYTMHCGCKILGTIHGESLEELKEKPYLSKWLQQGFFGRYLFLTKDKDNKRRITVFNERLEQLC